MANVTLQFRDLASLAKFRLSLKEINLELNVQQLTIACNCTEDVIDEAVRNYGATVITQRQASHHLQS